MGRLRFWASRAHDEVRILHKLLHGPLRGRFAAHSTVALDWTGRGLVIDLSAVHQDPDAVTVGQIFNPIADGCLHETMV